MPPDESIERQFQSVLLDNIRLISERIGGVERAGSETQSTLKDVSGKMSDLMIKVDRLNITVGVNGNGLVEKVKKHGDDIRELQDNDLERGSAREAKKEFWTPVKTVVIAVAGSTIATTIIPAIIKALEK